VYEVIANHQGENVEKKKTVIVLLTFILTVMRITVLMRRIMMMRRIRRMMTIRFPKKDLKRN
tara:strand:+ start:270 stop:455 length:186 start_codon:yes stop_codon:yes gene_type:complete